MERCWAITIVISKNRKQFLMNVTVVICTHDRRELLARTIESLNRAHHPEKCGVSILVIANACADDTVPWLEHYRKSIEHDDLLPLEYAVVPTPGKSNALNHAANLIRSEVTTYVDDDHRVDANYLTNICAATRLYSDADLFCGRILPDWDGSEPAWVHDQGPYRIYPLPVPRYDQGDKPLEMRDEGPLPGGGNLFLRTEWLKKVGGFSTDYGPTGHDLGGAEDLEWVRRALAKGATLRYVPDVRQYHYVDKDRLRFTYLLRKSYERSASLVRLRQSADKIPLFTYRKAVTYLAHAIFSWNWPRSRFYFVRFAAALGEIKGYRQVVASTQKAN